MKPKFKTGNLVKLRKTEDYPDFIVWLSERDPNFSWHDNVAYAHSTKEALVLIVEEGEWDECMETFFYKILWDTKLVWTEEMYLVEGVQINDKQ